MKKNDEFIGQVIDYTHDGLGIVKIGDFPFFIEGVIVGEKIVAKITKLKKNLGYARLIDILEKSSKRVEGIEKTSGANLLHMAYEEQLRFKTLQVRNVMNKIVGKDKVRVLNTLGMNQPYNYRNKSVVPVQKYGEIVKMGYYQPRSHNVVDTKNCSIQYEEHNKLINEIRDIIRQLNLSVYNEVSHSGAIRHIMMRTNREKTEIMIGIIAKERFSKLDVFVNSIASLDSRIKSVILNINNKKTNVIFGEKQETLYGKSYINDILGGISFKISLKSFYQVNPIQTEILYNQALKLANLSENDTIIDAYCGIGTISLFAAQKVKKVYGIEVVEAAVNDARDNAILNNIKNVEFLLGKSEVVIKDLLKQGEKLDAVIVDPPRKGCEESFLQDLASINIPKIVYVSCNPATLARDIKILQEFGYKAEEIQPVDMFPGTYHVESVVLLSSHKA